MTASLGLAFPEVRKRINENIPENDYSLMSSSK
jgi:hypothetical protein